MSSDRHTVTARVHGPIASEEDLLVRALQGFGIVSLDDGAIRRQAVSIAVLRETLERFLSGLGPLGAKAVLVVDDEEGLLPADVAARLRALAEMEPNGRRIVDVVTFADGASELETGSWFRVPLGIGVGVALLVCAAAVGLTALAYQRFGF